MASTRRTLLHWSAGLGAALGLAPYSGLLSLAKTTASAKPLNLLILGGTGFIGPHVVAYALARGHKVTVFTRGKSDDSLPAEVTRLVGDRDPKVGDGLAALKGGRWDAVIDNTGYVPRHVGASVELLGDATDRYLFTSTVSVYDMSQERLDLDSRLTPIIDPQEEDFRSGEHYGSLKVLCEELVQDALGKRATIVRPHIVAGPGDKSDRYTYWVARVHHGGEVLAPGDPYNPVQYIDVRDLSAFFVTLVENDRPGVFNGAGPAPSELSMERMLQAIRSGTDSKASFTWVPDAFLKAHEVPRFPLWISQNDPEIRGAARVNIEASLANGLTLRPLEATAEDTLRWWLAQPDERRQRLELNLEKNAEVLKAWNALS